MTSFQSSELTKLPVVQNSQFFAQRTVRPLERSGICSFEMLQKYRTQDAGGSFCVSGLL